MKGDISRDTYDKRKDFSRVLLQQGRVLLDSDWNEQIASLLHYVRTLAEDIIGQHAGPSHNLGFGVFQDNGLTPEEKQRLTESGVLPLKPGDFFIGAGRYYVDGILCENHEVSTYLGQSGWPGTTPLAGNRTYLAYLDVYEHHVTPVEDDYIREKALGGPDTATRARVVAQVRTTDRTPTGAELSGALTRDDVEQMWPGWTELWQPSDRGYLRAQIAQNPASKDPCNIAPDSKYRGAENQLYRVEIHRGGVAWDGAEQGDDQTRATFKWSRDNGSVLTALTGVEGDNLAVQNARGFDADGWVEVVDDAREFRNEPGVLAKLTNVEGDTLTIDPATRSDTGIDLDSLTKVRRWDQRASGDVKLVGGVMRVEEGKWIPLEDGVEVFFAEPPDAAAGAQSTYRAGDYWLIPARVATGNVEWPQTEVTDTDGEVSSEPRSLPPHGVEHHFAPLAILRLNPATNALGIIDCRCEFKPINDCEPDELLSPIQSPLRQAPGRNPLTGGS